MNRFSKIVNSNYFIALAFFGVVAIPLYFMYQRGLEQDEAEKTRQTQIEFLNRVCKKVGTSYDADRKLFTERTIYQCPDGQFHIR